MWPADIVSVYCHTGGVSSGWAYAADAVVRAAASPYPRSPASGGVTYPNVAWEIATPASARISALDPWSGRYAAEADAMMVPSFAQGVHVISGTCGSMPLWAHRGQFYRRDVPVLTQPDPDVPASVAWSRLYRDLVLYPYGWMLVIDRYADGFPKHMRHVPFSDVTVATDGIYMEGRRVPDDDVKRFDSPVAPGALANGRRILATAVAIEQAVRRFATFDIPSGYLKQTGGPDLMDDEIDDLLSGWEAARQRRSTAFLNQSLDYQSNAFDARQLQLVEARAAVTQDIARLLNVPPWIVNAETGGSLTYSTVAQQQDALQALSLWPYLSAVRDRLSMGDITPNGTRIEIPSLGFMRTDFTGRAQAYEIYQRMGVMSADEIRALELLPPTDDPGRSLT